MFPKKDIKIQSNYNNGAVNEKSIDLNPSLDYGLSLIKCEIDEEDTKIQFGDLESQLAVENVDIPEYEFPERFQTTEASMSDKFDKEYDKIKTEVNDKHEEFNTTLDYKSSNIKREFDDEEIKIQFGILEEEKFKYSTNTIIEGASSQKIESASKRRREKLYKCETCGQSFTRKESLNIHMRIHTGEKPYKCETCCQCFSHKGYLIKHMRIHTGEKPYKCETCGQCFTQKQNLNSHIRNHLGQKPYVCETCHQCYSCKGNLIKHMRIHSRVKSYKSETCGQFLDVRMHTDKKD